MILFEHYTYNKAQSGIKEHAHVISEAMWNFNPTGVSEYLSLVCKSQNYQHLIVTDTQGKIFQKAKGEKPVWIERLFISLKLIPSVHLVSNVIHDRKTIGQIEAIWNCDTKYLEISALFALILIYTIFHLNVRLLHSKHALEDRVAERTSELSSLNNSLQIEVAEHHLARKALDESEVRYRALFNSAGDAIFLMKGSAFFECNQKTLQMFECSRDDIIGSTVIDFSPPVQPDGRKADEKAMEKINAVMDGKPQFFEWRHKKSDGTLFDCEVNLTMANLPAGPFVQAIVRDITDRKQAEYEKEKLQAQLQQTQKTQAIGTLAGGIAHD
ncbi:MAG: PAS domain S-box protein, partial [Desulfobacteraceae bacterium]|nr:PAS domain S-box protein [Desulfobacteraceae bacterium]